MKAIFFPCSSLAISAPFGSGSCSGRWRRLWLFFDVSRPPAGRPVRATPDDGAFGVRLGTAPAPEAGAPPAIPEHERDQEENEADDHEDDADDVDVDAPAARVDAPGEDGSDRHHDEAEDNSHRVALPRAGRLETSRGTSRCRRYALLRAPVAQWT